MFKEVAVLAVTRYAFYLWYVMEKAKLVLDREKRALATPLELGSHESVTPVNTATKSAEGESVRYVLTDMCHDKHSFLSCFYSMCDYLCACVYMQVILVIYGCLCWPKNSISLCFNMSVLVVCSHVHGCSYSPVRLSPGPTSSELR